MNNKYNLIINKVYLIETKLFFNDKYIGTYIECDSLVFGGEITYYYVFSNLYEIIKNGLANKNHMLNSNPVISERIIKKITEVKYSDYLSDEQMIELLL